MDVIAIMNTIHANNSALYQERVPVLTKTNIAEVGNPILTYEAIANEFLSAFVNRVAFEEVSNRRFVNPLAPLKKGGKPYGSDVLEIYTNPTTAVAFDGSTTSDMLKVSKPDTKTMYHRMNRQDKYPVSISDAQLKTAFTSLHELGKFFESVITSMYSGDEIDEFLLMRNLVADGVANNKIVTLEVEYDGSETACKDLVKVVKTLSSNFALPSKAYNGYNLMNAEKIDAGEITACTTWTPTANQVFLIRSDVDASTDVEVLAKAFNMDKTEFLKRKYVVDSFGDADTLCAILDEKNFEVRDDMYTVRSFSNGSNLVTNYWLHHWQTISYSLFGNGVAIKKATA